MPNELVARGPAAAQNFFQVDLESGQQRQLTDLKARSVIKTSMCRLTASRSCSIDCGATPISC
jgi:hypothetical protein